MFSFSARLALPFRGLGIVTRGRLVLGHFVHMHTCSAFLGCVMLTISELSRQISLFSNLLRRLGYNNSRACISFLSTRRIWDVCLPVRDLPPFGHSMKFLKCVLEVTLHAGECISASLGQLQANLRVFSVICQLPYVLVCLDPSSMMTAATSDRCRSARMRMTSVPAGTPMAPGAQLLQLLILRSFRNSWLAFASVPSAKYRPWQARTAYLRTCLLRLRPLLQNV